MCLSVRVLLNIQLLDMCQYPLRVFASDYDILGPIIADVYESFGRDRRFHSYWQPGSGITPVVRHDCFVYGAHSAPGKLLVIMLNDTDEERTNGIVIDPAVIPVPAADGREVFSGKKFRLKNNKLELRLPPRESRFILFEAAPDGKRN